MGKLRFIGISPISTPPLSHHPCDIGFRCAVRQSSVFAALQGASLLYPAASPGGYFLHSDYEDHPWLAVDLGLVCCVGEIRVWNREDVAQLGMERASPLVISASFDSENWVELARWDGLFGGRLNGTPLSVAFSDGVSARYIKLHVPRQSYLHVDYVEILQMQPRLSFGTATSAIRTPGKWPTCDYIHAYPTGLFSGCSTALQDIIALAGRRIAVGRIDFTPSFHFYKDSLVDDIYPKLFEREERSHTDSVLIELCEQLSFDCYDVHKNYKDLPLEHITKIVDIVFRPSKAVVQTARLLLERSAMSPSDTIAIVYRGTDKGIELSLAPIDDYIAVAASIKERHPGLKVFIQTDQQQARDQVAAHFGSDCIFFDDLPVTPGNQPIHVLPEVAESGRKLEFAVNMLAAVLIASQCQFAILHTGNLAAWIAFYRGNSEKLYQFDARAQLVMPNGPRAGDCGGDPEDYCIT